MGNLTRILGLDLGERRIGVAVAEGETVASLDTIDSENRTEAVQAILKICREENIEKIVLGISKNDSSCGGDKAGLSHQGGAEAEDMVRSFALELSKNIDVPIVYVDETLTSKEAERILKDLKIDPRNEKYKREVDRLSAKLILEQYLNENPKSE